MIDEGLSEAPSEAGTPQQHQYSSRAPSASIGLLIFGFGAAAGFIVAFSGLGFLEDATGMILLVFLVTLMFIGALGLVVFVFRKPLWRRLFGIAEAQLELFAGPLSEVARSAVNRDPESATTAARDLVHMSLARYAWISTRRWIIGSLTALIAAMAALAGTALLFRQNELLQYQNDRIDTQIAQIEEQILLDTYTVQLAEAARNAQLVVEITAIAAELGRVLDRVTGELSDGTPRTAESATPVIDPLQDLNLSLIMRISSASRATKPYRFLQTGIPPEDQSAVIGAALSRRTDLPKTLERMRAGLGWTDAPGDAVTLIDRPASPERGQLLTALTRSGIHDMEILSFYGMDLSYAYAPGIQLPLMSFQMGQLSYADLSFATIMEGEFGGASLFNTRFRSAFLRDTSFASVPGEEIKPPYSPDLAFYNTALTGADFSDALLRRCNFTGAFALAAQFDEATLIEADFTGAGLSASTFRRAVLLNVDFTDADLRSADFDGAVVAGADFLDRVSATAAPGAFRADRFTLEPIDITEAMDIASLYRNVETEEILERVGNRGLYRVKRINSFED